MKVFRLGWLLPVLFMFLHVCISLYFTRWHKMQPLGSATPKVQGWSTWQRCLQAKTPPEGWGTLRKSLPAGLEMQNELGAAGEPALGSGCLHHPLQHPRVGEGNKNKM